MKKFGIDISYWQKGFNFDKAKAEGVEFAILRGAYKMSKDTCFEGFYNACKERNIPVGVYHYSMAKTVAEAKAEATFLIEKVLKGKQFEYPIYMDVEDKTQTALSTDLLTDIIVAYCETLEKAGYYVGIYSTAYLLRTETVESRLQPYDKWIAHWAKKCTYTGDYGMWQFGGETNLLRSNKIAGVVCDQDYALKDYPTLIKSAGLNGFGTKETVNTQPVETQSAVFTLTLRTLREGCEGEDVRALQILLTANGCPCGNIDGIFGAKTEAAVKSYQHKINQTEDGIAGPKTMTPLLGL